MIVMNERVLEIIFQTTLYGILEDMTLDLSFKDDMDLEEEKIYEILECIEEEYDVEMVDLVDQIDNGKQIVDYIEERLTYDDIEED